MKILFIVNNDYTALNGVAVVSRYLAEGLVCHGHDVSVITSKNTLRNENEIINGVTITRFNVHYNSFKKPVGEIEKYCKYLCSYKFDIMIFECLQTAMTDLAMPLFGKISADIYLHSHDFSGLYLKPLKICGDIKHSLGNTFNFFIWKKYYTKFVPIYINGFDGIFNLSKYNRDYEYIKKFYAGKHFVLGNAAEDMFFFDHKGKTVEKLIGKEGRYFVNISNYSNIKNQIGIIREYYKSISSRQYSMVFCGSKETKYFKELVKENQRLQKKYGSRDVYILCSVERDKIPGLVSNAALYLCGSIWEAYSISLIEAMAVGIPFVSTDVGNAKELPGGYVVDNISELSKAIDHMMSDDEYRLRCVENGKKYATVNCRKDIAVERLLQVILHGL